MVFRHEIISMSEGERKASHRPPKGMQIARVTVAETESLGDIGWTGRTQGDYQPWRNPKSKNTPPVGSRQNPRFSKSRFQVRAGAVARQP